MARMVPIKTFLSLSEALVASSCLQGHGIVAALNSYYHGSIAWHHLVALNGIQLSVLDIDLDRAKEVLVQDSSVADGQKPADAKSHCPATLSEIGVAVATLLVAGLPLPIFGLGAVIASGHQNQIADAS